MQSFPKMIDRYEIVEELGAGGMGSVYKARDLESNRTVAIKLIRSAGLSSAGAKSRFHREMDISSRFQHPNIVSVYDIGVSEEMPYMVMEYIKGPPLLKYIEEKKISLRDRLIILEKVALALEYAHRQKIIHRDMKPSNIMIAESGEPVLMDFGLAKSTEISDLSLTRSGEILGTPQYMAPEQAKGSRREIDERTDTYGLGAIFYHLLTGFPPAQGETLLSIVRKVVLKHPLRPRKIRSDIPKGVERICLKALQKKKKDRYASARLFAEDIRNYLDGKSTLASRFYRDRCMLHAAQAFFLLCVACTASWGIFQGVLFWRERESASFESGYEKGKTTQSVERAYIELSKAADWLEKKKPRLDRKKYSFWKRKIMLALAENYDAQGQKNALENPEIARIYFSRALEILHEFPEEKEDQDYGKWRKKAALGLLQVSFRLHDYRNAYETGTRENIGDDPEAEWMIAVSAYRCEEESALERFHALQQKMESMGNHEKQVHSLYYQGLIWLAYEDYKKARSFFENALKLLKHDVKTDFAARLSLHYAATLLVDVDRSFTEQEFESIQKKLENVEESAKNSFLYKETSARWLMAKAAKQQREGASLEESSLKEAVRLMDDCIHEEPEKAYSYYLRAKAFYSLKQYEKALSDVEEASFLEPSNLHFLVLWLSIFGEYGEPEEFQSYYQHFLRQTTKILAVEPDPFSQDFEKTRKEYSRLKFSGFQTIPFSQACFQNFFDNLSADSPEIRDVAEKAICSMHPKKEVLDAIRKKSSSSGQFQEIAEKLFSGIEREEKKREELKAIIRLAQISFAGEIRRSHVVYFQGKTEFLKKILEDEKGRLSGGNIASWTIMRFLAAKVLASLAQEPVRNYLLDKYIHSSQADLESRIMVAKALHESGLTFFDKDFVADYSGRHEFIQALVVKILSGSPLAPDGKGIDALRRLMEDGVTERVRVLSAFCVPCPREESFPSLLEVILGGHKNKDPHIRALCVISLWKRLYYYPDRRKKAKEYLPLLIEAIEDRSSLVKRAAQFQVRVLPKTYGIDISDIVPILEKNLEESMEPLTRCQTIIALVDVGNRTVFEKIGFNAQAPFIERLSCLIGFGRIRFADEKDKQRILWLFQHFPELFNNDPQRLLRGTLLYLLSRGFQDERLDHISVILSPILKRNSMEFLTDNQPASQVLGLIVLPRFADLSSEIQERLYVMLGPKFPLHIRGGALGVLIYHAYQKKSPDLEKLQRLAKYGPSKGEKETNVYRQGAIWGYTQAVQVNSNRDYDDSVNWNEAQIRHHRLQKIKRQCIQSPRLLKDYIECLERMMDLVFDNPKKGNKENRLLEYYACLLAQLYDIEGKKEKGILFLERACEFTQWRNPPLLSLWAQWMHERGKSEKALERSREAMGVLPSFQAVEIMKTMALIQIDRKEYREAQRLAFRQYTIDPCHPLSLFTLGEYYFHRGEYVEAADVFQEIIHHFPHNGEGYFGMARLSARLGEIDKAALFLAKAYDKCHLISSEQLERCPEFATRLGAICYLAAFEGASSERIADLTFLKWAYQYRYPFTAEEIERFFRLPDISKNPRLYTEWNNWVKYKTGQY